MEMISKEKLIEDIVSIESEVVKNSPYDAEWLTRLANRQHEIIDIIKAQPMIKIEEERIQELEQELEQVKSENTDQVANLEEQIQNLTRALEIEQENGLLLQGTIVKMAAKFTGMIQ